MPQKIVGLTVADLIKKLQGKDQKAVVEFLVYEKESENIVCMEMSGTRCTELMRIFTKRAKAVPEEVELKTCPACGKAALHPTMGHCMVCDYKP